MVPTPSGYDYGVVLPFRSDHSGGGLLRGDPVRANDPAIDAATNRRPSSAHRHRDPGGGFPCPCGRDGPSSAIANDPCCDGATTSPCGDVRATASDPCGCAFRRRDRGYGVSTTCRDGHAPCGLRWTHHFQPPAIRPPNEHTTHKQSYQIFRVLWGFILILIEGFQRQRAATTGVR